MPHWGEAQLEVFIRQDPADNNWYLAYANTDRRIRFAGDLAQQQANIEQLATNSGLLAKLSTGRLFLMDKMQVSLRRTFSGEWVGYGDAEWQAAVWEAAAGSEETAFTEIVEFGEEFCEILGI